MELKRKFWEFYPKYNPRFLQSLFRKLYLNNLMETLTGSKEVLRKGRSPAIVNPKGIFCFIDEK